MDSFSTLLIIVVVIAVFAKLYMNEVEKKITNNQTKTIQNNNKEEFTISKDTVLKIIAIGVTIIVLIMIRDKYEEYEAEQMMKKMMYGTTNEFEIEKQNKQMMQQTHEIIRQTNEMQKTQNDMMQKANEEMKKSEEQSKKMFDNMPNINNKQ